MKFSTPLIYKVQRFHQLAGMQNLQAPFLLVPVAGKFALLECCPQHLLPVFKWPIIDNPGFDRVDPGTIDALYK